jgi:hypothetical protein
MPCAAIHVNMLMIFYTEERGCASGNSEFFFPDVISAPQRIVRYTLFGSMKDLKIVPSRWHEVCTTHALFAMRPPYVGRWVGTHF